MRIHNMRLSTIRSGDFDIGERVDGLTVITVGFEMPLDAPTLILLLPLFVAVAGALQLVATNLFCSACHVLTPCNRWRLLRGSSPSALGLKAGALTAEQACNQYNLVNLAIK